MRSSCDLSSCNLVRLIWCLFRPFREISRHLREILCPFSIKKTKRLLFISLRDDPVFSLPFLPLKIVISLVAFEVPNGFFFVGSSPRLFFWRGRYGFSSRSRDRVGTLHPQGWGFCIFYCKNCFGAPVVVHFGKTSRSDNKAQGQGLYIYPLAFLVGFRLSFNPIVLYISTALRILLFKLDSNGWRLLCVVSVLNKLLEVNLELKDLIFQYEPCLMVLTFHLLHETISAESLWRLPWLWTFLE